MNINELLEFKLRAMIAEGTEVQAVKLANAMAVAEKRKELQPAASQAELFVAAVAEIEEVGKSVVADMAHLPGGANAEPFRLHLDKEYASQVYMAAAERMLIHSRAGAGE